MEKRAPRRAKAVSKELEPFGKRRVDLSEFKRDLSPRKLDAFFQFPSGIRYLFFPIDTLGVTKTVGQGRTNLTFIRPTIVQADAATPYAAFDVRESPSRNPAISMHFEPGAYGLTGASHFLMTFAIECFGQCTFDLAGYAGSGTLGNTGTKVLNGKVSVTLAFNNVPSSQQTWGALTETAGVAWNLYSVAAHFPLIVLEP